LLGTSESNGKPFTLNFPSNNSKYLSRLSGLQILRGRLEGSFGGTMAEENRAKNRELKEEYNVMEDNYIEDFIEFYKALYMEEKLLKTFVNEITNCERVVYIL
jgi:hypothetical protein